MNVIIRQDSLLSTDPEKNIDDAMIELQATKNGSILLCIQSVHVCTGENNPATRERIIRLPMLDAYRLIQHIKALCETASKTETAL